MYSFGGKRVEPTGKIKPAVSFGDTSNPRIEVVTFDIVRLNYPYLAILGRPTINTFEAMIHNVYLRMKIPAVKGVVIVKGDQQLARNIEKGFTPGIANMHNILEFTKNHHKAKMAKKANGFDLDPSNAETTDKAEAIIWRKMKESFAAAKIEAINKCQSKKEQRLHKAAKGPHQA